MADTSSYLKYLPAVLSEKDPAPPAFSLSTALRLFEKILTGIDDGVLVPHGTHVHAAIQDVIARIPTLFDPWATPPQYVEWLAQWVALQFPKDWDEYQRRKIASEIVGVYVKRGVKDGLDDFLDIYAVSSRRPRVVVDDASKILFTRPAPGLAPPVYTFVSQEPLVAPHGIALGPEGSFFLPDVGNNQGTNQFNPAVWRVSSTGQYDYAGPAPHAQPLGPLGFNPTAPVAVTVDHAVPFGIYILDLDVSFGIQFTMYYLTSPLFVDAAPQVATNAQLGAVWGIAMTTDQNGNPLILDRGHFGGASKTQIIEETFAGAPPVFQSNKIHKLLSIVEPLSFAVLANGNIVVGNAGPQALAAPADLVLVDRTNPNNWVASSLLGAVPAGLNPLVAPTAIVQEDATHLLVLDVGLRPFLPQWGSIIAQQAAVYRVDLAPNPPVIAIASETRQLVYPRGMVATADGQLHICDSGLPDIAGFLNRAWRAHPQQFSVQVHFTGALWATPQQHQAYRKFLGSVADVVVDEKPAQSNWLVISAA